MTQVRKIIVDAVMHTDMTQHFKIVAHIEALAEKHRGKAGNPGPMMGSPSGTIGPDSEAAQRAFSLPEDRALLPGLLLHVADVSNPAKPTPLAAGWALCVLEEFFYQGDVERSLGLPLSPGFDRDTTSVEGSQARAV